MNDLHVSADELVDYLHGELPPERDAAIAMHLAQCPACAEARDAEVALTEMVRTIARTQERALPFGVATGIRQTVRQRSHGAGPFPRYASWVVALPLAAAAAVLLWLGMRSLTVTERKTTIAAGYFVNRHAMYSAITPFADDAPIPPAFASDNALH